MNVDVVRRVNEAANNHDLDALLANLAADVEWRLIGGFADLMGTELRGRDAVRHFFEDLLENLGGGIRSELEMVREVDDRVVTIVRTEAAGGASGAPLTRRWGQVISFRDGQMSVVDNYYEASDALEAVGLREDVAGDDVSSGTKSVSQPPRPPVSPADARD